MSPAVGLIPDQIQKLIENYSNCWIAGFELLVKEEVRRCRIWLVLFTYLFHTINDRKRSQEEHSGQMVICLLSNSLFHLQQLQRFNAQDRKAQQSLQTSFFLVGYKKNRKN